MYTDTAVYLNELSNAYPDSSLQEIVHNMLNIRKVSLYCVLPYVQLDGHTA